MTTTKYSQRGVSTQKEDVHKAIEKLDKGLFPNAFCKILPDYAAGDDSFCNVMHADTAGTKTSLAYLYWKETGDNTVWKGIIQDALIMNLDDLICVGATGNIIISSTIGRNKNIIPGSIIKYLIEGTAELTEELNQLGISIHLAGGETADVGDIVRTLDVGFTAFVRMKLSDVVDINIRPGDVIVGLASFGQAVYEKEYNSGMGSNGLTSARHDVLEHSLYDKYPESYDPIVPEALMFAGTKKLTDVEMETGIPVGKLILSPTRTYAPVIKEVLMKHRKKINGIIHCSGGAQTKVMKFVEGIHVIKDNLFETPPLFKLIQKESGTGWKEMYEVFNMGHRMEIYTDPDTANAIIEIAATYHIQAKLIGKCVNSDTKQLTIKSEHGTFLY